MRRVHAAWLLLPFALTAASVQAGGQLAAQSLRPVAANTTLMQRPMLRSAPHVAGNVEDLHAQDATIDRTLAHFAAANAANPGVAAALDAAVAELSRNPGTYLNDDGSANKNAMQGMVGRQFLDAGPVSLPSANGGDVAYPNLGAAGDGDITALAIIVMMEAARTTREDLKAIMTETKAANDKKAVMRDAMRARMQAMQDAKEAMQGDHAQGDKGTLQDDKGTLQDDKDALSEMGEQDQLQLQMAMDRYSKAMSTLSNLMKKESDISSAILGNMK